MRAEDCDFAYVCVTVSVCASSQCHGLSVCLCVHRGFEGCSHLRLGVGLCQYMRVLELRVSFCICSCVSSGGGYGCG